MNGRLGRHHGRIGPLVGAGAAVASVGLLIPAAGACSQAGFTRGVNLNGGVTKVVLASKLVSTLKREGLTLSTGTSGPTSSGLSLPVVGGLVWSESGWGSVNHAGQLIFEDRKDGRQVRFSDIRLSFLPAPELTATASSGSDVELFNVHLREQPAAGITFSAGSGTRRHITYRNIGLDISASGAAAINHSLRAAAVKSGEWIGDASLRGRGQLVN